MTALGFTVGGHAWKDRPTSFFVGPTVAVVHDRSRQGGCLAAGWGWDHDTPIRWWPWVRTGARLASGNRCAGVYWLGFCVSFAWLVKP